mmetsp:Transcript_49293/g.59735  ORF Transcript_49293/g.59735 Transcript_49293/m.59735 type:complete len:111 (+) Transcript_49293:430-762(+)
MPPLTVCASDTIPTVTQILRRRRRPHRRKDSSTATMSPQSQWEYDYVSGRSVPGDGRVDFVNGLPPNANFKQVSLGSRHAKQMCWEADGGSWGQIWEEVVIQLQNYQDLR